MKIALIQQHAGENRGANLARGLEAVREAAAGGAELVVFPELSFLRFFPQRRPEDQPFPHAETIPGPTTDRFIALARELNIVIIINLFERDGDRTYDASPVIDADGSLLGVVRMTHVMEAELFHEKGFYHPGDRGAPVFETAIGRLGVAICYDRHFPEYMRALGVGGADLVVVPQAGSVGEWPEGIFEAELQVAAFQNGYFTALCNRVGSEEKLEFAGESFVTDPRGRLLAQAPTGEDAILHANLDFELLKTCPARRHFLPDRRDFLSPP